MVTARWITADVFDGLATIPDGSVDLVVTSPPFLALRSYLPADHPDKGREIGSEANPAEFIDVMLRMTAELRRVLAPHGSLCVELGDTYCVDTETEALTRRGWLSWHDIAVGDDVLALTDDGSAEWQPVHAVNVFPGRHRMLRVGGRGHSSLTTANHRWVTERRTGQGGARYYVSEIVTTDTLTTEHRIPIAAPRGAACRR